jgi:hypothetical protein
MFLYGTKDVIMLYYRRVVVFPFHYNLSHISCLHLQIYKVYKEVKKWTKFMVCTLNIVHVPFGMNQSKSLSPTK